MNEIETGIDIYNAEKKEEEIEKKKKEVLKYFNEDFEWDYEYPIYENIREIIDNYLENLEFDNILEFGKNALVEAGIEEAGKIDI